MYLRSGAGGLYFGGQGILVDGGVDFLNAIWFWAALGVAGMCVPIVLHLLNRKAGKPVEWGAMQFLRDSLAERSRRIQLEEGLLLACRCLLLGLLALALARPFVPAGSPVPWMLVLPALLLGVGAVGAAVALWRDPAWRARMLLLAGAMLLFGVGLVVWERVIGSSRFRGGGSDRDLALVIDVSQSTRYAAAGRPILEGLRNQALALLRNTPSDVACCVIGAGSQPEVLCSLTTDRARLFQAIEALEPGGGGLDMPAAIRAAVSVLETGTHPTRQVVVLGDDQRQGWALDRPAVWSGVVPDGFSLVHVATPLPTERSNVGLVDLAPARPRLRVGQSVEMVATLRNHGTLSFTPGDLSLTVDGVAQKAVAVPTILPGAVERLRFRLRFEEPGVKRLIARLSRADDVEADNEIMRVLRVGEALPVLLIEARPQAAGLARSTAFAEVALAPGGEAAWMTTSVRAASEVSAGDLRRAAVVLLCDVPRLPGQVADELTRWVARGGTLMVAPGPGVHADFYNDWKVDGRSVLPTRLEEALRPDPAWQPAPGMFEALQLGEGSDENRARFWGLWRLQGTDATVARFANGEPMLARHALGDGEVALLASALHPEHNSLPQRLSFVPLLHELLLDLVEADRTVLNIRPGESGLWVDAEGRSVVLEPGTVRPGLVEIDVPMEDVPLPLVVIADPDEGNATPMSEAELAEARALSGGRGATTVSDVLAQLDGQPTGRSLVRVLAVLLLGLLLAESGLTRWIATRRRLG